jgi:peptide/nickel transport system substrate-binding protein
MPPSARLGRGALAALLALALTPLAACQKDAGGDGDATSAVTLTVGATAEPDTLDFSQSANAGIPEVLLYNVYETLLKVDAEGQLQPLLATGWEVSDDRLTYTFTLDPAATFATGAAVDAEAVVASISRLKPAANAVVTTTLDRIADATAVDVQTVAITLTAPSNSWLYEMTSTPGIVLDPSIPDISRQAGGSGPYQFSSWTEGDRIVLTKNPNYWGAPVAYDEVVFRYFADPSAQVFALETGDIDLTTNLTSPTSVTEFEQDANFQVISGATQGEVVLGFNHQRPALQDVRVRQAINYAIDRAALVDTVWGGYGDLIGSMVAPTDPYYEDLSETYPYDPEKAKALLAEAGVTDLKLALRVPADLPYAPPAAQFIASQLAAVGVTATVEELDFTGRWLPEVFTNGDYDLTIVAHVEPRDIVQFANPDYYWHYDNAEFQALMAEADAADPADYVPLMKQAAQLLADDAASDWLWSFPSLTVARADLTGVPVNQTTTSFDLTKIRLKG